MNFLKINSVYFLYLFVCFVVFFSEAAKTNARISRRDVVFNSPTYIGQKTERMCNAWTSQACNGVMTARQIYVAAGMLNSPSNFTEATNTHEIHGSTEGRRSSKVESRLHTNDQNNTLEEKSSLLENSNEAQKIHELKIEVVGGRLARPKEYPHMALIGFGKYSEVRWSCGGTLISENFVLSAAHCVSSNEGAPRYIRLGELNLGTTTDDAGTVDFTISQIIVHPGYKPPIQYNDIALFKFSSVPYFTKYIKPICLNIYQNLPTNQRYTVVGWGSTGYGERNSDELLSVDLSLQRNEQCESLYRGPRLPNGFNTYSQICAGYAPGGKDSCQGDSGGPLQMINYRAGCTTVPIYKQVGIVSFGENCALPDTPAVYTRVSYFIPWIESIVWN